MKEVEISESVERRLKELEEYILLGYGYEKLYFDPIKKKHYLLRVYVNPRALTDFTSEWTFFELNEDEAKKYFQGNLVL